MTTEPQCAHARRLLTRILLPGVIVTALLLAANLFPVMQPGVSWILLTVAYCVFPVAIVGLWMTMLTLCPESEAQAARTEAAATRHAMDVASRDRPHRAVATPRTVATTPRRVPRRTPAPA